ncbi:MAG: pyruvate, water dikinase regulatory protein [Pseudomonadota bacterium]
MTEQHHIHLVSDSTGGTLNGVVRACLPQFEEVDANEHVWNLVRNDRQLKRVIDGLRHNPGPVIYTLVDDSLSQQLIKTCEAMNLPCIALLQPVLDMFSTYFNKESRSEPGLQHILNEAYFARMDAVDYALHHDDGQKTGRSLEDADIILVGVSRTSKTPTCIYLANRGIKAANIPYVPGIPLPEAVSTVKNALFVGLTESPERLVEVRRNRVKYLGADDGMDYLDFDKVKDEVQTARKLYTQMGWPVIDVTRRSIEETAAEIISLLHRKHENDAKQKESDPENVTNGPPLTGSAD